MVTQNAQQLCPFVHSHMSVTFQSLKGIDEVGVIIVTSRYIGQHEFATDAEGTPYFF